jgi:hypothetical protein
MCVNNLSKDALLPASTGEQLARRPQNDSLAAKSLEELSGRKYPAEIGVRPCARMPFNRIVEPVERPLRAE